MPTKTNGYVFYDAPCGRPAGTEGSLWVTSINARGENIIITVDA